MSYTLPINVTIIFIDDVFKVIINGGYIINSYGTPEFDTYEDALKFLNTHLNSYVQLDSRKFLLYWRINGGISETQYFSYFTELNDYKEDDIQCIDELSVGECIHFDMDEHFVMRVE